MRRPPLERSKMKVVSSSNAVESPDDASIGGARDPLLSIPAIQGVVLEDVCSPLDKRSVDDLSLAGALPENGLGKLLITYFWIQRQVIYHLEKIIRGGLPWRGIPP